MSAAVDDVIRRIRNGDTSPDMLALRDLFGDLGMELASIDARISWDGERAIERTIIKAYALGRASK